MDTRLGVGRASGRLRLLALGALLGLLAAALLCLSQPAPAAADGHPADLELVLSIVDDSDNVVRPDSEFTVQAELRFSQPHTQDQRLRLSPTGSALRLSGYLAWDGPTWHRLDIAQQMVVGGSAPLIGTDAAGGALPGTAEITPRAFDGRTLVARSRQHNLHIFDTWNMRQAAFLAPPTTAAADAFGQGARIRRTNRTIAVWHETPETAWMFVGSDEDTVEGVQRIGRLYIYRLDWTADPLEVTLAATLAPPHSETSNRISGNVGHYGVGVVISRDGSTLAVGAPVMSEMGAVYVYSRPDGPGEDWSDLKYADGVKVTPVAAPSWGAATMRPFNPAQAAECNAYCSRVSALTEVPSGGEARFGWWSLALSADGRVLVAGASNKAFASDTAGGAFTGAAGRANGEAYVFLAPNGDWRTAPEVTGTLIPAGQDARNFDPAEHYSPGPMRRVTEPDAVLLANAWSSPRPDQHFGREIAISHDGTTVAATAHGNTRTLVFQRDSADAWANAGELMPSATLTDGGGFLGGIEMKGDGSQVFIGNELWSTQHGRVAIFTRPDDGVWTGTLPASAARTFTAPVSRAHGRFGVVRYDLDGERLAVSESAENAAGSGQIWLTDSGCTLRMVDGERSWTCPITLSNANVVVPAGTEDGPFTISGRVTVELVNALSDSAPDNPIELSASLDAMIGTVKEVDSLVLGLATDTKRTSSTADDVPYPSLIERGEKTRLRLQILNANGKASSKSSVSSVVVTTTLGGLTSLVENGACGGGARRTICVIPTSALTSENVDNLLVELEHMDTAGTAIVSATVLDSDGDRLGSNEVRIDVAGPPAALAIAPPPTAVLGYDPSETADQRNVATLVVSATDKGDNAASVPTDRYSAKLSDADGKEVALTGGNAKAAVAWPLREGDDLVLSGRNPQARVTILAGADAPLAPGEYTLELSAGVGSGKLTTTQMITVSGGATGMTLSAEPSGEIEAGTSVTLTAMVTDANGSPVPNGTPVSFTEGATVANTVLVLLSPAQQLTSGGEVSVTVQAVGIGNAYVRAASDDAAAIQRITVAEPPPPGIEDAAGSLTIGEFNIWTGARATSASELYRTVEGLTRISKWDGFQWVSYGEANGQLHPGSLDFSVTLGTILWLSDQ